MFILSLLVIPLLGLSAEMDQETLVETVKSLSRQLMLQQFYIEQKSRSEGHSGIKIVRHKSDDGTQPYFGDTHTSGAASHIHDHAQNARVVGSGEYVAVLNGVEFKTRHNDYHINMPDTESTKYHKVVDIPYPEVPRSVLEQTTLEKQMQEMRMYFKAFKYQDPSIRDYRHYFKPILCYLEGAWTTNTKELEEPFHSDRHFIDAKSWMELQDKDRYISYTGISRYENLAYLPTTIIRVTEQGIPVFAQWNYRITCHPIQHELKLQDFKVIDDLSSRMKIKKSIKEFSRTRMARFALAPQHGSNYEPEDGYGHWEDTNVKYGLLDRIMSEVPGKDNYPGHHVDNSLGLRHFTMASTGNITLDAGRYHRRLRTQNPNETPPFVVSKHRGFADENMWVALNNQPKIAPMSVTECDGSKCQKYTARYSYAIPLEIIWLTPLYLWNPYNISFYNGKHKDNPEKGGRTGGFEVNTAYNGTSRHIFYRTPNDFFDGGEYQSDQADTGEYRVGVLDRQNQVRKVAMSGTRVFTPNIPGVGNVRLRYPVYPVHAEGSVTMKEVSALKEIVMDIKKHIDVLETKLELISLGEYKRRITV